MLRYCFLIAFAIGMVSCDTNSIEPSLEEDLSFFPLETGRFWEYVVEDIRFRNTGEIDTLNYFLKVSVVDSFQNAENRFTYVIHRLRKDNLEDTYELDSVWSARFGETTAIQVENNIPFVKMAFPISSSRSWDGNALNTLNEEEYEYEAVGQDFVIDTLSFENTATVIQNDFVDGITIDDVRKELFSQGIGLVYKQRLILQYCSDPDCLGLGIIELGTDYEQRLMAYGFE